MKNLGQDEMAKYPFLADAGQYLKDQGFTLEQFGSDPDLKLFVDKAIHRIRSAAKGIPYKSDIMDNEIRDDATLPKEVFSFLLAVILLKLTGINTLIRRFSLAEARRAEEYLQKDLKKMSDEDKDELAIKIIYDLSSITVKKTDKNEDKFF
ncbi:MAG: DNA primase, partial [Nitrosopumilus sp.]